MGIRTQLKDVNMLNMQSVAMQGLPHDISPEASADYTYTGWISGFERDGSEVYKYISNDNFLKIKIWEQFEEDDNYFIDKEYSSWITQVWYNNEEQIDIYDMDGATAIESLENVLKRIIYSDHAIIARKGWLRSYNNIAGKVFAPMWI